MTKKTSKKISENDIDRLVIGQVDDDSAWEEPVQARRPKPQPLTLPADLAARAAFLARLHRMENTEDWLKRIIQERVELEEAAYAGARQSLSKAG
jgi:hypothetical protein